jgi:curli biogenesis system outer membrane secretion channel CsgG
MNPSRIIIALLCLVLGGRVLAQDIDTEISNMTEKLATQITEHGKTKIAVIDFTDLDGKPVEMGKYIAEQMNIDFVLTNRSFSVLDRANLKSILDEHKLTSTGLVDPDTAKKLGQFAGVDALIMGTVITKGQNINITAKIVTTDTAEIIGAARSQFSSGNTSQKNVSSQGVGTGGTTTSQPSTSGITMAASLDNDAIKFSKKLGNLSVGLQSLQVVNGGRQYVLTMTLANISAKKSIWVAMSGGMVGHAHQTVTDPNGYDFVNADRDVTGVASTFFQYPANAFTEATEIKPGDSTEVTIAFHSLQSRNATAGQCRVQLGFLLGDDFNNGYGQCVQQSLMARMDAE